MCCPGIVLALHGDAVTWITAATAKRSHPPPVAGKLHTLEMARIAIRHYGSDAPGIMRRRVEDQVRHGDAETAEFWSRVARATSEILNGHKSPSTAPASAR
jgi:hypothetical protein